MRDDARESSSACESYLPPTDAFSFYPEDESAGIAYTGLEDFSGAQQDSLLGYNHSDNNNPPYSPIQDSTHPWQDLPEPTYASLIEPPAASQDGHYPRFPCNSCSKNFAHESSLSRHVKDKHTRGTDYWACTVFTCKMFDVSVRKENLRRHFQSQHPLVDIKKLGL